MLSAFIYIFSFPPWAKEKEKRKGVGVMENIKLDKWWSDAGSGLTA